MCPLATTRSRLSSANHTGSPPSRENCLRSLQELTRCPPPLPLVLRQGGTGKPESKSLVDDGGTGGAPHLHQLPEASRCARAGLRENQYIVTRTLAENMPWEPFKVMLRTQATSKPLLKLRAKSLLTKMATARLCTLTLPPTGTMLDCAFHTAALCSPPCFSVLSKTLPDSALSITCRVFRYVHEDNHKTSILIRTSLFSLPHSKSSGGIYLIIPAKRFCHLQISRLLARDPEESFKALCSMSVHTPYLQPFHRACGLNSSAAVRQSLRIEGFLRHSRNFQKTVSQ